MPSLRLFPFGTIDLSKVSSVKGVLCSHGLGFITFFPHVRATVAVQASNTIIIVHEEILH
jgi:hypothetical protein